MGLLAIVDTAVLVDSISSAISTQLSTGYHATLMSCGGLQSHEHLMRSRLGSGYCSLGPRSPTARLVMPWSFLSIAENCGVIRSGAQERRCYGPRLHPAILYCSNLDSASPSQPPIESQPIYHSLESEQQQDHVDVGKRVNKRTIGVGGINSRREGSRVGFLRPNGEDTLESLVLACTT